MPRRHQARNISKRGPLAIKGLEAVDVCTSRYNITRLVHTSTYERGKYKTTAAASTCMALGPPVGTASAG